MSKLPEVKDYIHDESVSTDFVDDREVSSFKIPDLLYEQVEADSASSPPESVSEVTNQVPDLKVPESKDFNSTDFQRLEIPEIPKLDEIQDGSHFQLPDLKEPVQPEIGKEISAEKTQEWFNQPRSFNPAIEQAKDFIKNEMSFFGGGSGQSPNTDELGRSSMQIEGVPSLLMEGSKPEFADQEENSSVDEMSELTKAIRELTELMREKKESKMSPGIHGDKFVPSMKEFAKEIHIPQTNRPRSIY